MTVMSIVVHKWHWFNWDLVFIGGMMAFIAVAIAVIVTLFYSYMLGSVLPESSIEFFFVVAVVFMVLFASSVIRIKNNRDLTHQAVAGFSGMIYSVILVLVAVSFKVQMV